jgi:hypothetical protein
LVAAQHLFGRFDEAFARTAARQLFKIITEDDRDLPRVECLHSEEWQKEGLKTNRYLLQSLVGL